MNKAPLHGYESRIVKRLTAAGKSTTTMLPPDETGIVTVTLTLTELTRLRG